MEDLLNRIISKLDNLEQGQKDLGDRLDNRIDKLENRIDKLEIRMENEVFDKMAALFDGYLHNARVLDEHTEILTEHSKILTEHTIILERIEDKISSHDIQIQVLDKTKSNKRKVK